MTTMEVPRKSSKMSLKKFRKMPSSGKKKSQLESSSKAAKPERQRVAADDLKWKSVKTPSFAGMDQGGGMMMLEELDGVDVEWEEGEGGRKTARFVVAEEKPSRKGKEKAKPQQAVSLERKVERAASEASSSSGSELPDEEMPSFSKMDVEDMDDDNNDMRAGDDASFEDSRMPAWRSVQLHGALKRSLVKLDFTKPTDIQSKSLPLALDGRDIVGVAETGSGKTLAYSLPVLSHLLKTPRSLAGKRSLSALILCPTRELALQVSEHLSKILNVATPHKPGQPPKISVGSVVGGLSAQKQKRILERGCDILIATPGRLWDLMRSNDELAAEVRSLRYLIIDEADRMIENGHFAELENIVQLTQRSFQTSGGNEDDPIFAAASPLQDIKANEDMQTFIFSATLSKDLQQNLKRKRKAPKKGQKRATALEDLVERLDFRDPDPAIIDLSPEGGMVASLKESMIDCITSEKDLYLYYFLLRYPGRSMVFVGSIDGIRRLIPLFETLQVPVYPLHSQLQQKQRLKNLDRFRSSKNGVLIATDVASRGLDIPNVDHVIHFNLPRTADAYVHRSGRTARAQNPGFSLQLCSAEDKGVQRALMKSLGRSYELPELPIEHGFLPRLKERLDIAKDIEKAQHEVKKGNHDRNWLEEAAHDLDVDIDPSMLSDNDDPDLPFHRSKKSKHAKSGKKDVSVLRADLKDLLAQPLMARGVSAKYPTSGSRVIVDDLLTSRSHSAMLGAKTTKAYDETLAAPRKQKSVNQKRKR